jgi:hypothetical protein
MASAIIMNLSSGFGSTKWYAELAPGERRTLWACFDGWALDALDVQIFSFAIPAIIAAFSITNADAGLIGTVTLVTSASGGWFAGMLADRFGRGRMLLRGKSAVSPKAAEFARPFRRTRAHNLRTDLSPTQPRLKWPAPSAPSTSFRSSR